MAYVAAGRADIYWERDIQTWDMAAGLILVREAGGYVTDCDGGDDPMRTRSVCCGNEALQRELLGIIKHANRPVVSPAAKSA
jgi:myo-inositol-1(or 4)-monophosphatase